MNADLTWDFVNRCKDRALHCRVTVPTPGLVIESKWEVLGGSSRAVSKTHNFS